MTDAGPRLALAGPQPGDQRAGCGPLGADKSGLLKLAVFDLDGTLKVEPDPYVYLHRRLGVMAEAEQ